MNAENVPQEITISIQGMTCAACQSRIEKVISNLTGVQKVAVNLITNTATIEYLPSQIGVDEVIQKVNEIGYDAQFPDKKASIQGQKIELEKEQQREYATLRKNSILATFFAIVSMIFTMILMINEKHSADPFMNLVMKWFHPFHQKMNTILHLVSPTVFHSLLIIITTYLMVFIGRDFYVKAWAAIQTKWADMNVLIAIGTIAAYVYSLVISTQYFFGLSDSSEVYYEAVGFILAFILIGKTLEFRAKLEVGRSIRKLMDLQPQEITIIRENREEIISIEQVLPGDKIIIRPGERIPLDGIILNGDTSVDESMLTGESVPVEKSIHSAVYGGTLNLTGMIVVRVINDGSSGLLAKIIYTIQNALAKKAKIQAVSDKVVGYFVPIILLISLFTFVYWYWLDENQQLFQALSYATAVLIIACPCAMGLAIPTAIMTASGKAAELGILIRNGKIFQELQSVKTFIFDKTGTITKGKPKVVKVFGRTDLETLSMVLSLTKHSFHPYSIAITDYCSHLGIKEKSVDDLQVLAGRGIKANLHGTIVEIGSQSILNQVTVENIIDIQMDEINDLPKVFVTVNGELVTVFVLEDTIREEMKTLLNFLAQKQIQPIIISGDRKTVVEKIAKQLSIQSFYAEVAPTEKQRIIQLLKEKGQKVAMVGDGINDAPALASADVGIAMGEGTDIAKETGDVILLRSNLTLIEKLIKLSKKTMSIMYQNLFWAFLYNTISIPIAAGLFSKSYGIALSPMIASAAMALSSISVVTNSLRLLRFN